MKYMDKLPTVISCCFCCFLRAGTVLIGFFSFLVGLIFAPNVSNTKGFWDLTTFVSYYSSATESFIQIILGVISIMLCIVSVMLIIGSCCIVLDVISIMLRIVTVIVNIGSCYNMPMLIEVYQWGAMIYTIVVSILFFILALMCFFVHGDCFLAGGALCALIMCNIVLNAYFVIVANSLRMSLVYLTTTEELSMIS